MLLPLEIWYKIYKYVDHGKFLKKRKKFQEKYNNQKWYVRKNSTHQSIERYELSNYYRDFIYDSPDVCNKYSVCLLHADDNDELHHFIILRGSLHDAVLFAKQHRDKKPQINVIKYNHPRHFQEQLNHQ